MVGRAMIAIISLLGTASALVSTAVSRRGHRMLQRDRVVLHAAATSRAGVAPHDGRVFRVFATDDDLAAHIVDTVEHLATAAISQRGSFAMSIGSGTTVAPLLALARSSKIDFDAFHVFFGNERTEGDTAFKCHDTAAFIDACGIPRVTNVHKAPSGDADVAALAYDAELRAMAAAGVLGERCGLPSLDLVLLGSGADGHCASLYPESAQVVRDGGRAVAAAAGKGGITLTIPALRAARHVLLSAAKPAQAEMVANALCDSDAATNTASPAGMIVPAPDGDGVVEWLLSEPSAALLPASDGKD